MAKFNVIETPIKDLLVIEPTRNSDKHGFFMESYSQRDFLEIGIEEEFVQDIHLKASRGVLRGVHFQRTCPQGRLVRVVAGAVLDVAVDLRPDSPTFGASHSVELSAENGRMFWIPEQFGHAFMSLENGTELLYKCTNYYDPKDESAIIWNDPILVVDWQFERYDIDVKYLNVTDRDKKAPAFRHYNFSNYWYTEKE